MAEWVDTLETGRREFRDGPDGLEAYRTFTVKFDSRATEFEARFAPGVPVYGAVHPNQGFIRALDFRGKSTSESDVLWIVEVHYRNPEFVDVRSLNPLLDPPVYRWDTIQVNEEVDRDWRGDAITNTVGEPIDPPVQREVADLRVTVIRNELNWTAGTAANYVNKLNDDPIFGFAPGIARMVGITADRIQFDTLAYWEVTYSIQFRRGGWGSRFLNVGYRQRDPNNSSNVIEILDARGDKLTAPTPLSWTGYPLGPDALGAAVFLNYQVYESTVFYPLRLE